MSRFIPLKGRDRKFSEACFTKKGRLIKSVPIRHLQTIYEWFQVSSTAGVLIAQFFFLGVQGCQLIMLSMA